MISIVRHDTGLRKYGQREENHVAVEVKTAHAINLYSRRYAEI